MINEISPHRFSNRFAIPDSIADTDYILYYKNEAVLLRQEGEEFDLPRYSDIKGEVNADMQFLFTLDDCACYLLHHSPDIDNSPFVFKEIRFLRNFNRKELAWIGLAGYQLMEWYAHNKYCGRCGSETQERADERSIACPSCGAMVYPKISPAVIVAIIGNGKILLAHNSNFPNSWYSLVAGYVDIGESLEEAVAREVKEEVGLDVANIRYYKSQPWPFSGSMMIGFVAEADCSQPIVVDNKEITEADWYARGNLPPHPPTISIAGEMIEMFERNEL